MVSEQALSCYTCLFSNHLTATSKDKRMRKKIVIRVFTAFSGYDSQIMALRRLMNWCKKQSKKYHIEFIIVGWCEIDENAIKVHNALYPELSEEFDSNTGKGFHHKDISVINWNMVPDFDLFFYSSCCQDISRSGKQRGLEEGSDTRSGLIWKCLPAIEIKKPKYCILENVEDMVSPKFITSFINWQRSVDALGYRSIWDVLCAANYDIPQNRHRVFMVSIRNDVKQDFQFPRYLPRTREINDFLEENVDEKYYLDDTSVLNFLRSISGRGIDNTASASPCTGLSGVKCKQIVTPTNRGDLKDKSVQPLIPTLMATAYDYVEYKNAYTNAKRPKPLVLEVWDSGQKTMIFDYKSYINAGDKSGQKVTNAHKECILSAIESLKSGQYFRLRKMTPREQFRFMGVSEEDIDIMVNCGVPDSELYKQAGNSIVVDVLFYIFKNIFINNE